MRAPQFFNQIIELYRVKDEQQRRDRIVSGIIILVVLTLLYGGYLYYLFSAPK